jgi:hypothetical protein
VWNEICQSNGKPHSAVQLMSNTFITDAVTGGLLAGTLSTAALVSRGHVEQGSAAAPVNAISHWFWPLRALRRDDVSLRHTATGITVHFLSSLFWSSAFVWLRRRRARPTPGNAVLDAAAVTATAAVVDLKVVPQRLSPGFERRLSPGSVSWVYILFGVGLAVAGSLASRRRY